MSWFAFVRMPPGYHHPLSCSQITTQYVIFELLAALLVTITISLAGLGSVVARRVPGYLSVTADRILIIIVCFCTFHILEAPDSLPVVSPGTSSHRPTCRLSVPSPIILKITERALCSIWVSPQIFIGLGISAKNTNIKQRQVAIPHSSQIAESPNAPVQSTRRLITTSETSRFITTSYNELVSRARPTL
ncbi:hypothetical protein DFH29DRAFT_1018467 [Suillus ampliporus]|nr:hypothetical protein DFH29DRAFT_1018467 [Suillus ampliporus]